MFEAICPTVYRKLRLRTELTQDELSRRLGVSRFTVMRYEQGRALAQRAQVAKLQELAKCSDEELMELICEQLSRHTGRTVRVDRSSGAYEPSTALSKACRVLQEQAEKIPPALKQALHEKVSTSQLAGLLFERTNAELAALMRDCLEPPAQPA